MDSKERITGLRQYVSSIEFSWLLMLYRSSSSSSSYEYNTSDVKNLQDRLAKKQINDLQTNNENENQEEQKTPKNDEKPVENTANKVCDMLFNFNL